MALDKVLKVYDDNGNEIDYDILAKDVKFLPDGKDLPTKLAELEDEIGQGGYAPPQGGIPKTDLAQSVQDSLDKADSALQDEDVAEVAKTGSYNDLNDKPTIPDTSGLATKTELQQGLGGKQDAIVAGNGIVIAQDGKTVSVDAEVVQPVTADGTFTIRIGNNEYTVSLNHTHENMAKLVVCDESDLPSTLETDTIYGVEEDGEISVLYVGGIPFYGGGGGGISTPELRRPANGSTITMIASGGGGVSETINIKGKSLTQSLIVEFANGSTGYSFDTTDLPTGVTYDSGTGKLTITKDAANAINGVDIVVVYTGSTYGAQGTLGISSSSVDGISCEVHLVAYSFESALAYWRGEDSASNGKWIDHNNSLQIVLNGTAAKTGDGYQFNNLVSQLAAYALFDKTYNSTLNAQIDKVFTCIVRCKVKFAAADRQARIIDFGALGNSSSGLSINCVLKDDGTLTASTKIGSATTGFNDRVTTANTGIVFTQNSYVDVVIKLGSRILANGKQELYCECGNGKCYGIIDTPVKWNFNGVDAGTADANPAAFVLGLGYTKAQYVEQLAPKAYADVVYQSIVIFNSEL